MANHKTLMNRRTFLKAGVSAAVGATALSMGAPALAGSSIRLKIGSLAPEGTPWYDMLRAIDKEFRSISGGTVQLKIYAGGVLGNETQMVKKMRIGQIQGAMLTSTGINDFDPAPLSLQIPGVINSWEELDFIMDKMKPVLNERIAAKGFQPLGWGEAGWARFFSKSPVNTPADLKALKTYAWEGDPKMVELLKNIGLQPVVIASTDMLPSLQTGLIDTVPTTALAALSYQWFGLAKYMVDYRWSPMIGGLLVDQKAWRKIPAEFHAPMIAAAEGKTREFANKIRDLDRQAIEVMQKNGLQVQTPADKAAWDQFAASTHPLLRGNNFPADIFDQVMDLHKAYLAQKTP